MDETLELTREKKLFRLDTVTMRARACDDFEIRLTERTPFSTRLQVNGLSCLSARPLP